MARAEPLSYERLVRVRAAMAVLVERHGTKYMPLFQRLDETCQTHETGIDRLRLAKQAAANIIEAKPQAALSTMRDTRSSGNGSTIRDSSSAL